MKSENKKILIRTLLSVVLLISFANNSFGERETITLDDKLSEALVKTYFNDAEDYFKENFLSINPEEDFSKLAQIHANIVLTTIKKVSKPVIVGLALSRPLIDQLNKLIETSGVPVSKSKLHKLVTIIGKTIEYEISVRRNGSVLLLGTSAEGDEIYSNIKIISFKPLKIIIKTDVTVNGNSTNFKLVVTIDGSGTPLVSLFTFETDMSRFYFKVPEDQAKPILDLARGIISNASEPTLADIFSKLEN